jgi:hypothetical protein
MRRSKVNSAARHTSSARIAALFPRSYDGSRARFRQNLDRVQQFWPEARLFSHRISNEEGLTIDWIEAPAMGSCEQVLIITTGEHGIEAYAGSAVMQVFIDEYIHRLLPETIGLLLVHAINPWGMKYRRRVNSQNVDLNRNFIWASPDDGDLDQRYDPRFNPSYSSLSSWLNPCSPARGWWQDNLSLAAHFLRSVLSIGSARVHESALIGQYFDPRGLYYGGTEPQEETRVLTELFRCQIEAYRQVLLLDIHTGAGPRYQMSLVNSALETRESGWFTRQFNYPLVVKANAQEFYSIQGDMIDYIYNLVDEEYPDKGLYATSFEFGTFGASPQASFRNLRAMVMENQLHWYGSSSPAVQAWVRREFEELYFPTEEKWRAKCILDARQAIDGILRAEGFFGA